MAEIHKEGKYPRSEQRRWYHFDWDCHKCGAEWTADRKDTITVDTPGYNESYVESVTMTCPWCGLKTHHPTTAGGREQRQKTVGEDNA